jgi:hypothetical protein
MEKNTLIAIVLSTIVLITFTVLQTVVFPPKPAEEIVVEQEVSEPVTEEPEEKSVPSFAAVKERDEERGLLRKGLKGYFGKKQEPMENSEKTEEPVVIGDINPYTGKEYQSNSVRMHPKRIGYVQVYNQEQHKWTDMTEWAFLGYQEREKALLGKNYVPPTYLD